MTRLEVRLLGPFSANLDGQPLGFAYNKARALLALLCSETVHPVPREWAAGLLWPDQPQDVAQHSLRQALSHLRAILADKQNDPPFLLTDRETLRINLHSNIWIDFQAFEGLLERCAGHRHRVLSGCPACFGWLREAADLYRGPFLAGFSLPESDLFEDWRSVWSRRLERQAIEFLDALVSGAEGRGEDGLVLKLATWQVEIDPYDEQAHRRVMLALARSGRRSQAAAHYQRLQSQLQDALGLVPEPETLALDRAIRAGDALSSPLREIRDLPVPVNPLIGRAVELSELETWLSDPARRLVNVTGPGGIGKTRLVIEVAQRLALAFADGGLYLAFSTDIAPGALPGVISRALNIPASGISACLREKDLLLVLDGCEHILQDREMVTHLLEAAPRLVVLAASRERLGLPGEWIFGLGGLEVPPPHMNDQVDAYSAVALFEQSARQMFPGFHLSPENCPAVGEICRLVGGVPLALNLAAAWVCVLPVAEIAAQIRRSLDILSTTQAGRGDQRISVRAVFEQSWQQLGAQEQSVFMRLSVFQDGFDRNAASQVAGASLQNLARLVDTSFISVTGENRYSLHDLLHQFAAEKLAQSSAEESTRRDHFSYFLDLARQNEVKLLGPDALKAFLWLSREYANLQSALTWSQQNDGETASRFAELIRQGIHQTGMNLFFRGEIT